MSNTPWVQGLRLKAYTGPAKPTARVHGWSGALEGPVSRGRGPGQGRGPKARSHYAPGALGAGRGAP